MIASRHVAGAMLVALCAAGPAAAQGNGNAFGKNKNKPPAPTVTSAATGGPSAGGAAEIQAPGTGIRNFGAWLDDASLIAPGQGYVSLGFGLWKMPGYREFDMPTVDAGVGLHRRVQVNASLPFYHASEPGGPTARGVGTMYLSGKVQLRDPSEHALGFSVTPAIEVLNTSGPGQECVSWAVPVNVEVQRNEWRIYGSAGYFSRRALFASAAVERAIADRLWITGALTHAYSMDPDPLSFALGLSQTHTDVTGGAAYAVRPGLSVFGSLGRTISRKDANAADLMLAGGVSLSFQAR